MSAIRFGVGDDGFLIEGKEAITQMRAYGYIPNRRLDAIESQIRAKESALKRLVREIDQLNKEHSQICYGG